MTYLCSAKGEEDPKTTKTNKITYNYKNKLS